MLLCSMQGTRGTERAIHHRLGASRIRGEWFRNDPEVAEFAAEAASAALRGAGTLAGTADQLTAGQKATGWLVAAFRARREWPSEDLFRAAREAGVRRDAIFGAKLALGMPRARKVTRQDGGAEWVWWVPEDWPHLADEPKGVTA